MVVNDAAAARPSAHSHQATGCRSRGRRATASRARITRRRCVSGVRRRRRPPPAKSAATNAGAHPAGETRPRARRGGVGRLVGLGTGGVRRSGSRSGDRRRARAGVDAAWRWDDDERDRARRAGRRRGRSRRRRRAWDGRREAPGDGLWVGDDVAATSGEEGGGALGWGVGVTPRWRLAARALPGERDVAAVRDLQRADPGRRVGPRPGLPVRPPQRPVGVGRAGC